MLVEEESSNRFSILDRTEQLQQIKNTVFDVVIIGGGITGAGIALDAASRGLSVCLIEKNDFASGTSTKSTKLIHGGLRYLKQFEIGLVKESGSERAIVHKLAPHLVIPEKMLLPLVKGGTYGKWMTAIGLKVYDILAGVRGRDRRRMLSAKVTAAKEPLLDTRKLVGGGYYAEYRTDDARLTIEVLKKAASYGATVLNYSECVSFTYDTNHKIQSVNCIEHTTQTKVQIRAKKYVSATGPWVDVLRKKEGKEFEKRLHLTKGVHLVFSRTRFPLQQPIYFDVPDGRMIFAISRGRTTYVGTTDTNYDGNLDRVVTTKEDVEYLLKSVNSMFPTLELTIKDIESNWAGLRPLIHEEGKKPSELSRRDEIFISKTGLISIAGGKLTGYRKMAKRVVNTLLKQKDFTPEHTVVACKTKKIKLTEVPLKNTKAILKYEKAVCIQLQNLGLNDPYQAWYLTSTYGKQSDEILNQVQHFTEGTLLEKLIRAELWYGVRYEMVSSLVDFFIRRTGRLYFDIQSVHMYRAIITNDLALYLHWSQDHILKEIVSLDMALTDAMTYYDQDSKG